MNGIPQKPESNVPGIVAAVLIFGIVLAGLFATQHLIVKSFIQAFFPNFTLYTDVFPGEWLITSKSFAGGSKPSAREEAIAKVLEKIRLRDYNQSNQDLNLSWGKQDLKQKSHGRGGTIYFIKPNLVLFPLHIFIAGILTFLILLYFPPGQRLNPLRHSIQREYERLSFLLYKQFTAQGLDFDAIVALPQKERERKILQSTLPEIVTTEVEDYLKIQKWVRGESVNPLIPITFFFRYRISSAYSNVIQGLVSGGAGILIFVIGLRGLKLIPPEEPSLILMALFLEFILLVILMFTFVGTAQEERLDRIVKELEAEQRDAIKEQTNALNRFIDSSTVGAQAASSQKLSDHEERAVLDEVMALMLKSLEKKKPGHGS